MTKLMMDFIGLGMRLQVTKRGTSSLGFVPEFVCTLFYWM
jgi:hypothetical protein